MDLASLATVIPAAMGALKPVVGLVKDLQEVADKTRIQAIQTELQQRIIETQTGMLEAQSLMNEADRYIRELERQIADFNEWAREAERYKLVQPFPGTFVFALQDESSRGEPAHFLCPGCFGRREKSILQGFGPGDYTGQCLKCEVHFVLSTPPNAGPRFVGGGY